MFTHAEIRLDSAVATSAAVSMLSARRDQFSELCLHTYVPPSKLIAYASKAARPPNHAPRRAYSSCAPPPTPQASPRDHSSRIAPPPVRPRRGAVDQPRHLRRDRPTTRPPPYRPRRRRPPDRGSRHRRRPEEHT